MLVGMAAAQIKGGPRHPVSARYAFTLEALHN